MLISSLVYSANTCQSIILGNLVANTNDTFIVNGGYQITKELTAKVSWKRSGEGSTVVGLGFATLQDKANTNFGFENQTTTGTQAEFKFGESATGFNTSPSSSHVFVTIQSSAALTEITLEVCLPYVEFGGYSATVASFSHISNKAGCQVYPVTTTNFTTGIFGMAYIAQKVDLASVLPKLKSNVTLNAEYTTYRGYYFTLVTYGVNGNIMSFTLKDVAIDPSFYLKDTTKLELISTVQGGYVNITKVEICPASTSAAGTLSMTIMAIIVVMCILM